MSDVELKKPVQVCPQRGRLVLLLAVLLNALTCVVALGGLDDPAPIEKPGQAKAAQAEPTQAEPVHTKPTDPIQKAEQAPKDDPQQIPLEFCRDITDDTDFEGIDERSPEYLAYSYFFLYARQFDLQTLKLAATRDLSYAHLYSNERKLHRGKLIHFSGELQMLRQYDATLHLKSRGIEQIYEGWLWLPEQAHFVCVMFSELPEGLKPAERMDRNASFDGYFFKRYSYTAKPDEKGNKRSLYAPLLIGKTIQLGPASRSGSMFSEFLTVLVGCIAALIVLALVMSYLYRQGDARVKSQVQLEGPKNPFTETDALRSTEPPPPREG